MMVLGNHFSEQEKIESIRRSLVPGQILYLFCHFTTPPKDKYLLLVCTDPIYLFFVINSQINDFVQSRQHLRQCQVMLIKDDYSLQRDSYVNCSEPIDSLDETDVIDQVLHDMSRVRDRLNEESIAEIKKVVSNSVTLIEFHKEWIINSFSET